MTESHHLGTMMPCPSCGSNLTGTVSNNGSPKPPSAGDCTLCGYCRALLIFEGNPIDRLRYPTLDEEAELLADPDVKHSIDVLAEYHRWLATQGRPVAGTPPEEKGTTR